MPIDGAQLRWLYSEGGPLLLLAENALTEWRGVETHASPAGVAASEYDRACSVVDYLGVIAVGDYVGLVLGDEPMQTTWLPLADSAGGLLVRWMHAENESAALECARSIPASEFEEFTDSVGFGSTALRLFDAAIPGRELKTRDTLVIVLPWREAAVATAFRRDERASIVVHRIGATTRTNTRA